MRSSFYPFRVMRLGGLAWSWGVCVGLSIRKFLPLPTGLYRIVTLCLSMSHYGDCATLCLVRGCPAVSLRLQCALFCCQTIPYPALACVRLGCWDAVGRGGHTPAKGPIGWRGRSLSPQHVCPISIGVPWIFFRKSCANSKCINRSVDNNSTSVVRLSYA